MPGVIFLDFDGPIFPTKAMILDENNGDLAATVCKELELHPYVTYWKADPISICMLNFLYKLFPYELVISSSWADEWLHEKKQIENMLIKNDLVFNFHKTWKTPRDKHKERHEQIKQWLLLHPEIKSNYIILDDHSSGDGLTDNELLEKIGIIPKNVIIVDYENGISQKQFQQMISQIKHWE